MSTDDNQFKVDSVIVKTTDGGRFNVEFENKWYTRMAPGNDRSLTNRFNIAIYESPLTIAQNQVRELQKLNQKLIR